MLFRSRTGGYTDVDVNPSDYLPNGLYIKIEGKQALVTNIKMRVPEGIGFYPKNGQSGKTGIRQLLLAMIPVPGRWQKEQNVKEVQVALSLFTRQKVSIDEYDTEVLDGKKYFLFTHKFEYGSSKGKPCTCISKESVKSCLNEYKNKNAIYQVPFAMCRGRAKSALKSCCLKINKDSKSTADLPLIINYSYEIAGPYR